MKLFRRDYTKLTAAEMAKWDEIKKQEIQPSIGKMTITKNLSHLYPKAARHFESLFPNNYLDVMELDREKQLRERVKQFGSALRSCKDERGIVKFIREKKAWFIVGSIVKDRFNFGHHALYLFPEFPLGTTHRADYLLVGKNSGGYHFVFVELESVAGKITLKSGDFGEAFRKGLSQIESWDRWLNSYFGSLAEVFSKLSNGEPLPEEFRTFDKTRVHFMVIAGRRGNFTDKTRRLGRQHHANRTHVLHYDNIAESAASIIGNETY